MLEGVGHEVTREYYFNDFNAQVRNLGLSVLARREGQRVPEDGYHGDYVAELAARGARRALGRRPTAPDADPGEVLGRWASERVRAGIEESLAALGVRFDVWTSEGSLHDEGWVARALDQLRAAGHVYEADGATWFRSTPSATTRIGSSSARTASRPTSRRTSATSPRSSAAASTS